MDNVFDILMDRGYTKQVSHPEIRDKLGSEKVTFYTGYDPTADSLHVGHFIQLMTMSHLQKSGHQPIVLIGGGTVTVGDPSGRSDLRLMMTMEQIQHNADAMKQQMTRFMDFSPGEAIMVNNGDWLLQLNYIEFLRDIGVHFSVNRMLAADCYKNRLEGGLTFFEFNYMLMQSYDFLHLYREYGATLQCGGDDQWSNILSGADLIRRKEQAEAFAMTTQLLTNSDGTKMGKTAKGALWLDPKRTSPYEFYQYWRNVEDGVVQNCLAMLTWLPMDEVRRLGGLEGSDINEAKKVLAYEVTNMIHGQSEADKAAQATEALFGGGGNMENIPTTFITESELADNPKITDLMALCGLAKSRGEARRLVDGGGVSVDDKKVSDIMAEPDKPSIAGDGIIIRKGKKHYHRIILK